VPVNYACNPSYSKDRDQEYHGSKPALENSLQDPIYKKIFFLNHKKGLVKWPKL
jgi:hypothetical protein